MDQDTARYTGGVMTARRENAGRAPGALETAQRPEKPTTTRRCIACLSPVSRHWHTYCGTCRAWLRFAHGLRTMRAAMREVRA